HHFDKKKTKEVLWNSSQNLCGEKNRWVKPFPESPGQTIPETGGQAYPKYSRRAARALGTARAANAR
ncbi:MAG: hypothetical protein ACK5V5_10350, partial [Cyclobacteriaceae bacterium]